MRFSHLLRLAMDFGLGKLPQKGSSFAVWTEDELSAALEAEFSRRFTGRKSEKSKDNTLAGWLHYDKIPKPENLSILVAVLTCQERIEHSEEWRKLFRAASSRRATPSEKETSGARLAPTEIYPRGCVVREKPLSFRVLLEDQFPGCSDEHLRSHLSLDHALDFFERAQWRQLPDQSTAEMAMHFLLHRGYTSAVFEASLQEFLTGRNESHLFDRIPPQELSHVLNTSTQPVEAGGLEDFLNHPICENLATLASDKGADCTAEVIERAIFREFFRNSGFYLQTLKVLWSGHSDEQRLFNRLQLRLHQAGIEVEMRKSLFSTSKAGTGESFSLKDIYTPLPCVGLAQWEETLRAIDDHTEFLDVEELVAKFCVRKWRSTDITDRALVLRGDPGSGKTSAIKNLAWVATNSDTLKDTAVLLVPFQKGVEFSDDGALKLQTQSLLGFQKQINPIDIASFVETAGFSQLLIFFDGLDELGSIHAHEGQVRKFSRTIAQNIDASAQIPCKFVISGRDQAFRPTEFEIDLSGSSYRLVGLSQERVEPQRLDAYIENHHISYYFDLRSEWLEKFCRYKSLRGNILTANNLKTSIRGLDELSTEPLLLFLLARLVFVMANRHKGVSFDLEGVFDISRPSGITKNDIYSLLIASIRRPQHREESQIDRPFREGGLPDGKKFEHVLGCMAIPTWHNGTGRRGTIKAFFNQAEQKNILAEARRFTTAAEESDTTLIDPEHLSLMSVFYFETWDGDGDEGQEYEFTHKSFGSYLIARELFLQAINLAWTFQERNGEAQEDALERWITLTSHGYEEPEILRFLNLEIDRYNHPEGAKFLGDLGTIGETTKQIRARDVTVDTDDFRIPFQVLEDTGRALIADLARRLDLPRLDIAFQRSLVILFSVWTAFARGIQRNADESYSLDLPDTEQTFRTLASPIDANELDALYNADAETNYFSESLSSLDLEGHDLSGLNLINGRICNSNLKHAHVQLSALDWAAIEECQAEGLTFISCQMNNARFFRTDAFTLVNSVMRHGLIDYCRFEGMLFDKTELTATRFLNCRFENCEFRAISFEDCVIDNCNFIGCRFTQCVFDEADFTSVAFKDCHFELCSASQTTIGENVAFCKESGFPKIT